MGMTWAAAFPKTKHLLTCAPVMAYYKHNAKTRVTTDTSPVGLGAILEQEQPDGRFRPFYYASRKLYKTEQHYSQFEREALAVKSACETFFWFLHGADFKPPSARVERLLWYQQQFRYKVTYVQRKYNSADVLSRLPLGPAQSNDSTATEVYACSVVSEGV